MNYINYIIILMMCILSTAKMSFQSAFGKQAVKSSADALVFNGFIFAFSAVLFLPKIFGCSSAVWAYAAVSAVCTVMYQIFYTKALSVGNVSMTVLIVNFSMVINVLVSYVFYKEPISWIRFLGIILTVFAFVISSQVGDTKSGQKNWLLFTICALISTSAGSISQKVFGESRYSGESQAFISCLYIIATVITLITYLIFKQKGERKSFKIGFHMLKYAMAVGLSLALYQAFYTYALANIDGTFLFPAYTGGAIVLSTLSGVIIFKDKLNRRQVIGIFTGIVSIILMNF